MRTTYAIIFILWCVLQNGTAQQHNDDEIIVPVYSEGKTIDEIPENADPSIREKFLEKLKKDFLKEYKKFRQQVRKTEIKYTQNLLSLPWINIGTGIKSKPMTREEIEVDSNKLDPSNDLPNIEASKRKWTKTQIRVSPLLRGSYIYIIPGIQPITVQLGADLRVGKEFTLEIESLTSVTSTEQKTVLKDLMTFTKGVWQSAKVFKIPLRTEELLNKKKYPIGTVYRWNQDTQLVLSAGVDAGYMNATVGERTYLVIHGQLKKELTMQSMGGKTYAQLSILNEDQTGLQLSLDQSLLISVLQIEEINTQLKLKLISSSHGILKGNNIAVTYLYDLSDPKSRLALSQALIGNLTLSQQLEAQDSPFIFKSDESYTSLSQSILNNRYGLFLNNFNLNIDPLRISLARTFKDPMVFSKTKIDSDKIVNHDRAQNGSSVTRELTHFKERSAMMWFLTDANRKHTFTATEIKNLGSMSLQNTGTLFFQEEYQNKKVNGFQFRKFQDRRNHLIALLGEESHVLTQDGEKKKCDKNFKTLKSFFIYPEGIKKMISSPDQFVSKINLLRMDADDNGNDSSYKKDIVGLFEKLSKRGLFTLMDNKDLILEVDDILKDYKNHRYIIDLLAYLLREPNLENSGYLLKLESKNSACSFSWLQLASEELWSELINRDMYKTL
jgi:hypothetical protein